MAKTPTNRTIPLSLAARGRQTAHGTWHGAVPGVHASRTSHVGHAGSTSDALQPTRRVVSGWPSGDEAGSVPKPADPAGGIRVAQAGAGVARNAVHG
jgi:hypothetical protein